jgi:8-oxo-dGTP diphosphatase
VGAVILRRESVLLVERGREPLKGYWSLPGGLVETGERIEEALRREILEETGLHVRPVHSFDLFERIMLDASGRPEYHYVLVDFLCRVVGGELRAGDDVSRVEWVRRAKLTNYHLTSGTPEMIEKAFDARRKRT